jgi:S-adenosylmethionine decarboxylase
MKMPSTSISPHRNASSEVTGIEWVIDAIGCDPQKLRDERLVRRVCDQVIADLDLNVVGEPLCHQFPEPGGVTALYLLRESHLACHTYPEHSLATFNLYCCRERDAWAWASELTARLGADRVRVQSITRGGRGER